MEKIRLQKFFTDNKIMSRRNAEKVIEAGNVKVNGVIAKLGDKVDPEKDTVTYNGKVIKNSAEKKRYIMLNKPLGYVSTASDEKGRQTVLDLVSDVGERVYPVGRLDMYSEGLLILTNDGELTNRLTHPKNNMSKVYSVMIKGDITPEQLSRLTSPMEIDGYKLKPVKVRIISQKNGATNTLFTLNEGRNRQIRKMCEQCGLTIMRLTRIAIGKLKLNDLERGKWRELTENEVAYLSGKSDSI
ncbi:MAG: rRNA pseudouridine synthase [Clostridia bacterium]|nr:rRNA pseudouridine synthase [Clostridia bacterium]MBQ8566336.1 rRNA pseudouridine synthase [Clostridia bacterium]